MRFRATPAALAAIVLATVANLAAPAAGAATPVATAPTEFTVDTTTDAVDADPTDGRCRTVSGACTLRAAVMAANARPGSEIVLPPGRYRLTIPPDPRLIIGSHPDPTTGDLNIEAPTTIRGVGARTTVVDANRLDRVFRVRADTLISDVTLTGGEARQRELPFTDTGGGAIANGNHLTLRRVAVTGNSAGYGGGVFNTPGSHLDLIDSTVSANAAGEAGGIRFDDGGTVTNSTIADNRVTDPGDRPGSLGGRGGGIDIRGLEVVEIRNSTITANRSSDGGGGINIAPAYLDSLPRPIPDIVDLPLGRLTLRNSVVAGNTVDGAAADCEKAFATIASQGHNIDGDGSCRLTAIGDLPSRAALIGPLTDNGGPTDTAALLPGSPALDAADGCPATDQRGVARPQGAGCDIGAYEHIP
ncbi:choice-of-anchor Q domain-containing protein [Streptomyces sp. NPDC046931]|uniref:choice-of-anchor Q domain-containing protein n=1 Tax=Streptomyces sp. NPDC046931 TaxID=3154806 RepID=UPI0033CB4296